MQRCSVFLCCSDIRACWANARSSTPSPSPTLVLPYDSVVNRTVAISWNFDLQSVQEELVVLRGFVCALHQGFWLTCSDTYCQCKLWSHGSQLSTLNPTQSCEIPGTRWKFLLSPDMAWERGKKKNLEPSSMLRVKNLVLTKMSHDVR